MGLRAIPHQFEGLLWLESNAQTLLKAEMGEHAPAGRKKALAQSLSKSLVMFEMSKIPIVTHCPHNFSLALNAAPLSIPL